MKKFLLILALVAAVVLYWNYKYNKDALTDYGDELIEKIEDYKDEFGELPESLEALDLDDFEIDLDSFEYTLEDGEEFLLEIKNTVEESDVYESVKGVWE
ncbi:MAG: hypothetical protein PF588_02975 [Candidatus Kapabacteria bacterium]|nr:hypothetical protein [Candidatus Kapabacteria bacterium]